MVDIKIAKPFGKGGSHITLSARSIGKKYIILEEEQYESIKKVIEQIEKQKSKKLKKILSKEELKKVRKNLKEAEEKMPLTFSTAQIKHMLVSYYKNLEDVEDESCKSNVALYVKDKEIREKILEN